MKRDACEDELFLLEWSLFQGLNTSFIFRGPGRMENGHLSHSVVSSTLELSTQPVGFISHTSFMQIQRNYSKNMLESPSALGGP